MIENVQIIIKKLCFKVIIVTYICFALSEYILYKI